MKTLLQFMEAAKTSNPPADEHVCPKCERELEPDHYCSRCDHYVDREGRIQEQTLDNDSDVSEAVSLEKGKTAEAGTRHEYRSSKVLHDGKHVATINTYRGRSGGWVSQVDNPDGSSAHKKYGIDLMDTKKDMLRKIKNHHKGN